MYMEGEPQRLLELNFDTSETFAVAPRPCARFWVNPLKNYPWLTTFLKSSLHGGDKGGFF